MKIIIDKEILLQNLNEWTKNKFVELLNNNKKTPDSILLVNKIESKDDSVNDFHFTVLIYPTLLMEVNEDEMKVFLNIIDNHYYGKMFIEYLGNARFNLIFER